MLQRPSSSRLRAAIFGCSGLQLTSAEREFFSRVRPFGLILFARNIDNPVQVFELTAEFRACVGNPDAQVMIDQEGGRVARLKPPFWAELPPAEKIGSLYLKDKTEGVAAAKLLGRRLAAMLVPMGITINAAPVADLRIPGANDVIGNRAFSADPLVVAPLARAVADGMLSGGIFPVVKHIPGHGRAMADSHKELPVVDEGLGSMSSTDFVPFAKLNDLPFAMTAHIVYQAIDKTAPATHSAKVIQKIIRERIGFSGLLMTDCLSMEALSGSMDERATKAYDAGCDLALYCEPKLPEMEAVASVAPLMAGETLTRWKGARKHLRPMDLYDPPLVRAEFEKLMSHYVV